MSEHTETLTAIMLQAERFCASVQRLVDDHPVNLDTDELRLKLNQANAMLGDLQRFYDEGNLDIKVMAVRTEFRFLIITLLWVAFRARKTIDFKTFRMLVSLDAAFSIILSESLEKP